MTIIAKSQVEIETPFWYIVRANDKFGNTVKTFQGEIAIFLDEQQIETLNFRKTDQGAIRSEKYVFTKAGIYILKLTDMNGNKITSNPIEVIEKTTDPKLFFGDLHGQTGETVGSGTIEEYFQFGLNEAGIDFISHAANAFQITNAIWSTLTEAVKRYNLPGRLVTYLGYEWSGNPGAGGDHNVYYLNDDERLHRCSHALIDDKSDLDTDRYPISEIYKEYKGRKDVMVIPHIGGRKASLDIIDVELTPFIEIVSVHGHFDWFLKEAIDRQLKVGYIGSSDTHSCRPGDSFAVSKIEAVRNGLTAVYSEGLTRECLWEGFTRRHVYATTGARIIIKFLANGVMMGDTLRIEDEIHFIGKVIGTKSLEKVDLYQNHNLIKSFIPSNVKKNTRKICFRWTGARVKTRRRNLDWSGHIKIQNGTFKSFTPFAFDLPHEGIIAKSENLVEYTSSTAGDFDGFYIEFAGNKDTVFHINNAQINEIINYEEVENHYIKEIGNVEIKFEAFLLPLIDNPRVIQFDEIMNKGQIKSGAYYLRVQQYDGEKAWTSPIFIEV